MPIRGIEGKKPERVGWQKRCHAKAHAKA